MRRFRKLNLRYKIFISFTASFLAITLFSAVCVFGVALPAMREAGVRYEKELVRQASRRVDDFLSQANILCIRASYSSYTRAILEKRYDGSLERKVEYYHDRFDAFRLFQDFSRISNGIVGVFVYNVHGLPYYYTIRDPIKNDFNAREQAWYPALAAETDYGFLSVSGIEKPPQFEGEGGLALALRRNVRSIANFKVLGQAEVILDPGAFEKILAESAPEGPDALAGDRAMTLVDARGRVVCSQRGELERGGLFDPALFIRAGYDAEPFLRGSSLIIAQRSDFSGWYLFSEARYGSVVKQSRQVVNLFAVMGGLTFFLIVVLSLLLSWEIVRPIVALEKRVAAMRLDDFDKPIELDVDDEFRALVDSLNEMAARSKEYVKRIYRIEGQKRDAEILALQTQINPHFTMNTLNTIKYLAALQNSTNIVVMIEDFALLMKAALKAPNELITLEEELNRVRAYMRIQDLRFFGKIKIEFEADGDPADWMTMGMVLQPIVENSVVHGIQPKMESHQMQTGLIRVSVRAEDGDLAVHVVDDGIGMPAGEAETLLAKDGIGIGLNNVNTRIKLRFGERYGLTVRSEAGAGCDVLVRLPQIRKESN